MIDVVIVGGGAVTPAIGFRFRYTERGSGVANSISIPENFYWE